MSQLMETHNFFFRVSKAEKKQLEIDQRQMFQEDGLYIWQYETPWARMKSTLFSFMLIGIVLLGVMFPLWPSQLRTGVWYLSMVGVGLICALIAIAIVRGILFVCSLPFVKSGLWLFPNLFADVGVVDSFIPLWGYGGIDYEQMHRDKYRKQQKKGKKEKKKNAGDSSFRSEEGNLSSSSVEALLKENNTPRIREITEDEEPVVEEIEAESRPSKQQ